MMKKLIIICTLLLLSSCSVLKNKSKQKQSLAYNTTTITEKDSTVKATESQSKSVFDSTIQKSDYNGVKSFFANKQNFQLTNNGKCSDPGMLRLVQFTDSKGNQTSIPVNDNTDLSFGNETKLETELINLKTENYSLKKENDSISNANEIMVKEKNNTIAELNSKFLDLDLKTKSSPISAFIWVGSLSIAAWEIFKFYLRKQKPI